MWCGSIRNFVGGLIGAVLLLVCGADPSDCATASISLQGCVSPIMRLSVIDFGAMDNGVQTVANTSDASASVTFGDTVGKHGSEARGHLGLQVKANCPYDLRMSRYAWSAQNLAYKGQPVDAANGGSFIRVSSRGVTGWSASNVNGTSVAPEMTGSGRLLSQMSSGPVAAHSTLLARGSQTSFSGGIDSPNNGVVVHLELSCVDGKHLAAIDNRLQGYFQTTLQFQVFSQRI